MIEDIKNRGRKAGSRNKKTLAKEKALLEQAKKELGITDLSINEILNIEKQKDIIKKMYEKAMDDTDPQTQAKMLIALADRIVARKTATDLTSQGEKLDVNVTFAIQNNSQVNVHDQSGDIYQPFVDQEQAVKENASQHNANT